MGRRSLSPVASMTSGGAWGVIALKVLVLTHELASATEKMPYLAVRLAPIQVVECFGRAAEKPPRCPRHHAVWSWWQERFAGEAN